jgi:hypothetical protein
MSKPTYKQIQDQVKKASGSTPKTCWIAHVKEMYGLKPRKAPNRLDQNKRANLCPPDKIEAIKQALITLGLIGPKRKTTKKRKATNPKHEPKT